MEWTAMMDRGAAAVIIALFVWLITKYIPKREEDNDGVSKRIQEIQKDFLNELANARHGFITEMVESRQHHQNSVASIIAQIHSLNSEIRALALIVGEIRNRHEEQAENERRSR